MIDVISKADDWQRGLPYMYHQQITWKSWLGISNCMSFIIIHSDKRVVIRSLL